MCSSMQIPAAHSHLSAVLWSGTLCSHLTAHTHLIVPYRRFVSLAKLPNRRKSWKTVEGEKPTACNARTYPIGGAD